MIGNPLLLGDEGYQIQRSLRFRSSATAYLNRTPGTAGNLQKFTWSGWVKRGKLASYTPIFCSNGGNTTDSNFFMVQWLNTDTIAISGALTDWRITTQVFRDPSAWYHIVFAVDTTLATAANRILLYINGVQVTAFGTSSNPTQNLNTAVNNTNAHYISTFNGSGNPSDMYLAEVNFIDGQALTPSSFGAINPVTGVWSATKYAGTYGTNGFYLNFTDNSAATATTIGKDYSGNGNNWTPNNISVTAGSTYDSMLDAPLGAGGGERGNYAVMNPLDTNTTGSLRWGNLDSFGTSTATGVGSIWVTTGKWYAEAAIINRGGTSTAGTGFYIATASGITRSGLNPNGTRRIDGTDGASLSAGIANNDVIGLALDADAKTLGVYLNGTLQGTLTFTDAAPYTFNNDVRISGSTTNPDTVVNFGQRPFSYTPPTGFKALHTGNLAAPVIALPAQNMAVSLYTGTGATQSISNAVNGVSFQPDWVWIKSRNAAQTHGLFDSNRGVQKLLQSNSTAAELTSSAYLTAFDSGGFSLGTTQFLNGSGDTFVGWQWKAGGTAVTNTAGSITSSVSANTTAGFSVVTYTGNGTSNATVGHGLGVAPSFFIIKNRSSATDWPVYHKSLPSHDGGNYPTNSLRLNTTGALANTLGLWVAPTSTVIQIDDGQLSAGNRPLVNTNGSNYVAYCFAPIAGYSAFGSYTGNASTDGPFVYLGFRPRFIMIKRSSDGTNNWEVRDTARDTYNTADDRLFPNTSSAEDANNEGVDFLSNGFKVRNSGSGCNASGATYIYAAFAENPFKNSLAR